jgi:hypothetical protein
MRFTELAAQPISYNNDLNPKIWQNDSVRPEVRSALLQVAKDFKEFIDVPIEVQDVIIAGAQANYTYTDYSDLDLHLVVDYASVNCDQEAAELFDSKRLLFKRDHNVSIRGIPVEPGVEDAGSPTVSAAYSILHNQWVREPQKNPPKYNPKELNRLVDLWTSVITYAVKSRDLQAMTLMLKLLRKYRKLGLATAQAEYNIANLVYKSLRNSGDVQRLQTAINQIRDQQLSIGE